MPSQDKRLYPLTSCTIGVWRTPDKAKTYLLVLDQADASSRGKRPRTEQKRFVILITRESSNRDVKQDSTLSVNWLLNKWGCIRQQLSLYLNVKNPFSDHTYQPAQDFSILAFEIRWSDIVGMDFKWPLTEDARLVLEAAVISKRVFASVDEVCLFYQAQPKPSRSPRMSLNRLLTAGIQDQQHAVLQHAEQHQDIDPSTLDHQQLRAGSSAEQSGQHQQQQPQQFGESLSRASSWASGSSWRSAAALEDPHEQSAAATGTADHSSQDEEQLDQAILPSGIQIHNHSSCAEIKHASKPATGQYHAHQHHEYSSSWPCSSVSDLCAAGSLSSAPTLSAGIGVASGHCPADQHNAIEAATLGSAAGVSWEGFAECRTPPLDNHVASAQASGGDGMQDLNSCNHYDSAASLLRCPLPACSDTSSPRIGSPLARVSAAAASGAFKALRDAALMEGSTWSAGPASPAVPPFDRFLEVSPAGYVTAPCSVPSSPKISLGGRTGSGFFSSALGEEEPQRHHQQQQAQLLQKGRQPVHELHSQHHHDRRRYGDGSAGKGRSRLRTQACPLCNQSLMLPLHVLQQRFHQKQEQRRKKVGGGVEQGVCRPRSACSLEQLLLQTKALSSNGNSPKQALQQRVCQIPLGSSPPYTAAPVAAVCGTDDGMTSLDNSGTSGMAGRAGGPEAAYGRIRDYCSRIQLHKHTEQIAEPNDSAVRSPSGTAVQEAVGVKAVARRLRMPHLETATEANIPVTEGIDTAADPVMHIDSPAAVEQQAPLLHQSEGSASVMPAFAAQQDQVFSQQTYVYRTRTVVLTFKDPTLPHKLKQFVNSDVHLLKLYESGLPGWAVMLPTYGLYYRPVLRRITWLLFVLFSVISMAMGFYDLYKNVPYFKQIMVAMFRPAAAVFEWLEGHTQIRLSILLTYMLGRTQIMVQLIKLLTRTSLQPILGPITAALAPLASAASAVATTLAWLLQPLVSASKFLWGPVDMLVHAVWLLFQLIWQLLSLLLWSGPVQLLQGVSSGMLALLQLFLLPFQALLPTSAGLRAGWSAAKGAGQVARSAVPVVKSSAAAAATGSSWHTLVWYPLEAFELMRVSTMRIMRALQAVVKLFVTLGTSINQHRLSLMLQLRHQLRGGLRAAADSPAGRVATAVAVKMGQEQRVQRIQRQLHRADSGLISMGSELLGHADSIAVSTALSLDAEMSMSLNATLEEYVATVKGAMRGRAVTPEGADSDEEVTSALIDTPSVVPAQLHNSAGGLRHRVQAVGSSMHHQRQGNKQVTFAVTAVEYNSAASVTPAQQLPAMLLRRSMDAAMAGTALLSSTAGGLGMVHGMGLGSQARMSSQAATVSVGSLDTGGGFSGSRVSGTSQQQLLGPSGDLSGVAVTAEQPVVTLSTANALSGRGHAQAYVYDSVALSSPAMQGAAVSGVHANLTSAGLRRRRNSWG